MVVIYVTRLKEKVILDDVGVGIHISMVIIYLEVIKNINRIIIIIIEIIIKTKIITTNRIVKVISSKIKIRIRAIIERQKIIVKKENRTR